MKNFAQIPQPSGPRVHLVNAMGSGEGGDRSSVWALPEELGSERSSPGVISPAVIGSRLYSAGWQFCETEIGSGPQGLSSSRVIWCPQRGHGKIISGNHVGRLILDLKEGSISFSFHLLNKNPYYLDRVHSSEGLNVCVWLFIEFLFKGLFDFSATVSVGLFLHAVIYQLPCALQINLKAVPRTGRALFLTEIIEKAPGAPWELCLSHCANTVSWTQSMRATWEIGCRQDNFSGEQVDSGDI